MIVAVSKEIKVYWGSPGFTSKDAPGMQTVSYTPWNTDMKQEGIINSNNMSYDPITYSIFMTPNALSDEYNTTSNGNYSRLTINDFSGISNYIGVDYPLGTVTNNWYIKNKALNSDTVMSNDDFAEDSGFVFRFLVYPDKYNGAYKVITLYFGGGYSLDVFGNGKTDLYLNGNYVQTGYITGGYDPKTQQPTKLATASARMVMLMILPFRNRDILFYSDAGGAWIHTTPLVEGQTHITDAGQVGWNAHSNACFIQIMQNHYDTAGFVTLMKYAHYNPGEVIPTFRKHLIERHGTTITYQNPIFEEHDLIYKSYQTISFNSAGDNNIYSPTFIDFAADFQNPTLDKYPDEIELNWKVDSCTITWSENYASRKMRLTIDNNDEQVYKMMGKSGRGLRVVEIQEDSSELELFYGITDMPDFSDLRAPELTINVSDYWKRFRTTRFDFNLYFDGMAISDAIKYCARYIGVPEDRMYVDENLTLLPIATGTDKRAIEAKCGSTVEEALKQILEYAGAYWRIGFQPINGKIMFCFLNLTSFSNTPVKYFYNKTRPGLTYKDTFLNEGFNIKTLEPECSHLRLIGKQEDSTLIVQEYRDFAMEDPTTPEDDRPTNWIGEHRFASKESDVWSTTEVLQYLLSQWWYRMTNPRTFITFEAEWDINCLPNYVVAIETTDNIWTNIRLTEVEINHAYNNSSASYQPATYTGEVIGWVTM